MERCWVDLNSQDLFPFDHQVCQPCQEHQEQAKDQRGPQGRTAERVPGGDQPVSTDLP